MKFKFAGTPMASASVKAIHQDLQSLREKGHDLSLSEYIGKSWDGAGIAKFYEEVGLDLSGMTVGKMLNTSENNRFLLPEIIRDAIVQGLEYTPIHTSLVAASESIDGSGLTMPFIDWREADRDEVSLRDTNEGATITEGQIITWSEKQVTISKKARGLKQTYESIMWTPIDLAAIYFQELGTTLGADLDRDFIDVIINGDQANGSEAAPVIGVTTANTLTYTDLVRAWVRFRRIGRNSTAMICNETDAITILNMDEFKRTLPANGVAPSGVTLNVSSPLPSSQDILVHDSIPAKKIVLVDRARAVVQLTAMPLLIESEKIVSRQIQGEYVSIITGFANIFRDGRMIIDYSTNLTTNPGPTPPAI